MGCITCESHGIRMTASVTYNFLIREPLSWEARPCQHPGHISPAVNHRDTHQQQRRTGSPSRRDLSISEGGKSRLEQEAARCPLYIYQVGLPQEGLVGTLQKSFKGASCFKGKPRTLKCFFLANCEEEGLPRRVLGLIHFSPSIEEALMPCPVVFFTRAHCGEDQDKSGTLG